MLIDNLNHQSNKFSHRCRYYFLFPAGSQSEKLFKLIDNQENLLPVDLK